MAKVYINEYARLAMADRGVLPVPEEPPVDTQVLDTAGTHLSAAFNAATKFITINADGVVSYKTAVNPTATTDDMRISANETRHLGVSAGQKIDVIANT